MDGKAVNRLGLRRDALAGQTAVITGSGRGIGREMAQAFAWLGAKVVIAELADSGTETEALIRAAGGEACFIRTDVSSEDSVAALAQKAESVFGTVDILVNNAISCPVISVLEMPVEVWDRVMAVNLRGGFLLSRAFLPGMLAQKRGIILNMISAEAMPYLSAYIASKQGLQAFSQSLAAEVGEQGLRVLAMAVGMVDTPGIREVSERLAPQLGMSPEQFMKVSLHPAYEGLMPPDHAAAAAAYLVARLADQYHGETVTGYEVLEMAGVIQSTHTRFTEKQSPEMLAADTKHGFNDLEPLGCALVEMLAETEAELNQLPVFVRPLARQGFKSKAGMSLPEWKRTAEQLTGWLVRIEKGEEAARSELKAQVGSLSERLDKLAVYFREVPAETGKFTKDQELLRSVQQISDKRLALIAQLQQTLETITR